ncbi:MAG: PaaI family thioesterase [Actinomycetota bacterium]|nr:PaaI family thioesterase [Actinomycetota bacterium]
MAHADDLPHELSAYLRKDPLAAHLGIEIEEIRPGYARARMIVRAETLNALGVAHGGATMSLADTVFAAASNSHGRQALAIDLHTEFLSAGALGEVLVGVAEELHLTRRMAVYRVSVVAESDGRRVAEVLARVYRRDDPLPGAEVGSS